MERLQKFLAHAGIASRRSCEELILQGKVKINGALVTTLGTKVDPLRDIVEIENKLVKIRDEKVYLLLNKPDGYVTTVSDPQGRPTVMDLLREVQVRVYPVGRLDYQTEGLLLLTNDGKLSFRLTHPKHKVIKVYETLVKGSPASDALKKLREGIKLEDGMTAPALVKVIKQEGSNTLLEISIHEGRNRQIRRMCKAINHPVLKLKRLQIGPIRLGNLPKGNFRYLKETEIKKLMESVGLE
ncbi:MAG: pseudouridine synthase [Bacillota bacterium]